MVCAFDEAVGDLDKGTARQLFSRRLHVPEDFNPKHAHCPSPQYSGVLYFDEKSAASSDLSNTLEIYGAARLISILRGLARQPAFNLADSPQTPTYKSIAKVLLPQPVSSDKLHSLYTSDTCFRKLPAPGQRATDT